MKTPHVLIVEDEPSLVMPLELLLRKNGFAVDIARNGPEALAAIAQTPFDLVLLDLQMPDVDGPRVCRQLRQNPGQAPAKVIFLSAKSGEPTPPGADVYLAKPCSTRQVMEKVRELLS